MSFSSILSSIFPKKNKSVLGIDIGTSAIKVVQIRRKHGRAVLETYGELALGPYAGIEVGRATNLSNDKLISALRDILRESKTTSVAAGVALPLSSSLITFITVPQVPDKQLAEVIALEARKYIPVPTNEVMLDYSIIPKDGTELPDSSDGNISQKTKPVPVKVGDKIFTPAVEEAPPESLPKQMLDALVVAIHNEYINNYQAIASGSGIHVGFYELEIFSSIRASVEAGIQGVMILDMGAHSTKLYIIERGLLRASHIINKGSQDITLAISKSLSISITDAENLKRSFGLKGGPEYKELTEIITVNLDYIFYEANATLLNYQKKYEKNISKVILTGGGVMLKGFIDLAKISFQTEIIYSDPFSKLETPAFLAEQFLQSGPEFAVAIGCALRRLSEEE
jgi:type IV pilus assembly protein PilM